MADDSDPSQQWGILAMAKIRNTTVDRADDVSSDLDSMMLALSKAQAVQDNPGDDSQDNPGETDESDPSDVANAEDVDHKTDADYVYVGDLIRSAKVANKTIVLPLEKDYPQYFEAGVNAAGYDLWFGSPAERNRIIRAIYSDHTGKDRKSALAAFRRSYTRAMADHVACSYDIAHKRIRSTLPASLLETPTSQAERMIDETIATLVASGTDNAVIEMVRATLIEKMKKAKTSFDADKERAREKYNASNKGKLLAAKRALDVAQRAYDRAVNARITDPVKIAGAARDLDVATKEHVAALQRVADDAAAAAAAAASAVK